MLALCRRLGFAVKRAPDRGEVLQVSLSLRSAPG
jgi:hypothetical protein